jgi:small subunit ribosomal protein S13
MARIAGVGIPKNKRGVIALTYIFGIGKSRAIEILEKAQVSQDTKVIKNESKNISKKKKRRM